MSCNVNNELKKITINELFSGIGSQRQALQRLGVNYEIIGISEIDKYAIKSYEAIYGSTRNYGDISKIEKLDYADFWTYSSPCQDFSICGKQQGAIKGKTRSGLLYEVERLLNVAKEYNELPKYLMLENVKNLVGKKFKPCFDDWIQRLDNLGYNTYWKILNAKDYGIPQNRERVFAISIRKDIDTGNFEFPIKQKLNKYLKDTLEDKVDDKYYISEKLMNRFQLTDNTLTKNIVGTTIKNDDDKDRIGQRALVYNDNGIIGCLTATDYKEPKKILLTNQSEIMQSKQKINKCLKDILEDEVEERYYLSDELTEKFVPKQRSNIVGDLVMDKWQDHMKRIYDINNIAPTLSAMQGGNIEPKILIPNYINYRIRKLTPLECWRLMGQRDEDFYKAKNSGVSNTQLYKQAGNSIVVDVLYHIFKNLFDVKDL